MAKNKAIWEICQLLGNNFDKEIYEDLEKLNPKTLGTIKERLVLIKRL